MGRKGIKDKTALVLIFLHMNNNLLGRLRGQELHIVEVDVIEFHDVHVNRGQKCKELLPMQDYISVDD